MRKLGQAKARNQSQQSGIRYGPGIVHRAGLTAKGKSHGLRLWTSGQVVHRIPNRHECGPQQQDEGNAHRHRRVEKGHQLNGQRAKPIRQQPVKTGGLPQ